MNENLVQELERTRLEVKRLAAALQAEEIKTAISAEYATFGLWEYDIGSDTLYPRKKLDGIYGDNLEPIQHFRDTIISRGMIFPDDLPAFRHFCDDIKAGEKETTCEIRVFNDCGKLVWIRFEGKTAFDDNGNPQTVIGRVSDVTSEKGGADRKDALTDAYLPELFHDLVLEKRSGKNRYNNAAFLGIRIDDFHEKLLKLGSEYCDYIQKTVAEIIRRQCPSERDMLLTRLRDGEFLMYLEFSEANALDDTARNIVNSVRDYIYDGEPVTVSVGISPMRSGSETGDIFEEAATALDEAEKSGGSCFMHYTLAMSKGIYDRAADISAATNGMSVSSGSAKLYNLIIRAFCYPKERTAMIKEAFKTAGQCLGAASIVIFSREDKEFKSSLIYNSQGEDGENAPSLEISCSEEGLSAMFGKDNSLRVLSNEESTGGIRLTNGAVCAECRAVRFKDHITEMFAVVFDSRFELSGQNISMIDLLGNTLSNLSNEYKTQIGEKIKRHLRTVVISDHRMEGFSIIPGEFVIDDVGDNAAEHYDLRKGDVCYQKIYGLDKPCENCPALQLESNGSVFDSTAFYNEKESRWLDISASVGENIYGDKRYIISYTDITDCLGKIRMTDKLTGLMTFNAFTAEALRATAEADSDNTKLYAVVLNIADFMGINEEKGYETGDAILVTVADVFEKYLGEGELLSRSDNARFAALLKGENQKEFEIRLSHLMSSMQKQVYDKLRIHIVLLAGVCALGDEPIGVMGAVDRAITAQKTIYDMTYYAENMMAFYDGVMRENLKERRYIEDNMIDALKNGEFRVFYQAKVDIETGKIVGAEALARWIRPGGEIISPGKFVPIFEENGFITEMDFSIYRGAVADIARWLRMGLEVPMISMNVSRRHIADERFCEKFNALVDGLGVPHEYIELEITESLLTENINNLVKIAEWFKERGYRISIDDFGSGYSSLNLITMLPFDTLKIDGGFFLRNDLTDKNKKVITSVVSLAKSLNLKTVSEGVETQPQVDFLRALGCDMIQGFFYYKPMPGADFEQIITAQNEAIS